MQESSPDRVVSRSKSKSKRQVNKLAKRFSDHRSSIDEYTLRELKQLKQGPAGSDPSSAALPVSAPLAAPASVPVPGECAYYC